MSSNVSGSSNLLDLQTLVSNLQSSVNNISSAFSTVQSNISNLNQYDTLNNVKIAQINTLDGEQEQEIEVLKNENLSDDNRLDILEAKFPITNISILNETISKVKILGLTNDLSLINTAITTANNRITDLNTLEQNDVNTLTLNLNNQITKQSTDNTNINNSISTLLSSVPGSQNTFQNQIDIIKSNQLTDEGDISTAKSNISILQGDNSSNKNRLGLLEADNSVNKVSISSLQSNLTTANQNINNNTSSISTLNTNLSSQISKESSDVANLQSQINSLSTNSTTNNSTLQSQITVLSNKQTTDYNDLQGQITTNKNTEIADVALLNGKISDNLTTETNHYNSLNTALNNLTTKQNNDNSTVQSNLTTYIGSNNTRNTTNETDISNLKTDNNTNKTNISSLQADNTTNKNNISTLQSKVSVLEADNSTSKANITTNTNDISTINSKINVAESSITNLLQDVNNCKSYDLTNTTNINNINNTLTSHTTDINLIKNTTIPDLNNKFLIKNDPLITESILGKLKCDNLDSINDTLNIGQSALNINIGSVSNNDSKVINIGGNNDVVNILGSLNNVETTNTQIKDKLILLNKGAFGNIQSGLSGIQIRDNNNDNQGYITTSIDGSQFLIKPPQSENIFKIKDSPNEFYDLTTKLYVDLQNSSLQTSINGLILSNTELNNQITTINNTTLDNIPFSKLNAFPSTVNFVMLGNGSFSKVNNNVIDNNSINPIKLTGCSGDALTYLAGDGLFKILPSGNFSLTTKVLNSNFDDNTISVSKLVDGVSKTYIDNKLNNFTSDNIIVNQNLNVNGLLTATNTSTNNIVINENIEVKGKLYGQNISANNYNPISVDNMNVKNINVSENVAVIGSLSAGSISCNSITIPDNSLSVNKINDGVSKTYVDAQNANQIISDTNINNSSISASKLKNYPNDNTKYLSGDGTWSVVSGGGSSFDTSTLRLNNISSNADVSINENKLINVLSGVSPLDAVNKAQLDAQNTSLISYIQSGNDYLISYVDDKYLNVVDASALLPNNTYIPNQVGGGSGFNPVKFLNVHNTLNLDTNNIINVVDPVNAQDAATKNYVDTSSASTTYVDNSLTYNLTSPTGYSGSLDGISANLLILVSENYTPNYAIYEYVIKLLGGKYSTTLNGPGIYINIQTYFRNGGTSLTTRTGFIGLTPSGYNSNYDAVILLNGGNAMVTDMKTILDNYYTNGKGVIVHGWAVNGSSGYGLSLSKDITNGTTYTSSATSYSQNNQHPILYGLNNITSGNFYNSFTAINGATSIGSISGTYAVNYLDETNKARRVDLNFSTYENYETTRVILQALLWAGKKINNISSTTTISSKLNLNNPLLTSLKVYNTPSTDYDVVNKLYLSNLKYFKSLSPSNYFVYVDILKSHIFNLYYMNASYNTKSYNGTLYLYPYDYDNISYRLICNTLITEGVIISSETTLIGSLCYLSLSLGVLKVRPNSNNLICQEM